MLCQLPLAWGRPGTASAASRLSRSHAQDSRQLPLRQVRQRQYTLACEFGLLRQWLCGGLSPSGPGVRQRLYRMAVKQYAGTAHLVGAPRLGQAGGDVRVGPPRAVVLNNSVQIDEVEVVRLRPRRAGAGAAVQLERRCRRASVVRSAVRRFGPWDASVSNVVRLGLAPGASEYAVAAAPHVRQRLRADTASLLGRDRARVRASRAGGRAPKTVLHRAGRWKRR